MGLIKAIVFLMVGAGLIVTAMVTGIAIRGFIGRAASAPGSVSHLNAGGSHPEIEFTTGSGEKISYPQGGLIFGYRPGDKVRVLYGREDPRGTARVDAFGALWFTPLILFGLGFALIIGGLASLVSAMRLGNPGILESWEQHFTHHPSKGGVPTRERFLAHHAECLAEAFTVHRSPSPNALLLMGAPGSGKSKLLGKSYLSHPDLVVINPDAYKERLPEYASGKGADLVHEESSWLASQVRIVAIGRSCDLLNDAVGSDKGKYADLIRRLRESGYQTQLLCVHVLDVNVLLNRVAQRALRTGRIVGEAFIREAHSLVPKAFESLRHAVNLSRMVDGTDGTVVYEEVEGKATVRKADFLGRLGEAGRKLST